MEKVTIEVTIENEDDRIIVERYLAARKVISSVWEVLHNGHRKYENSPHLYEGYLAAQADLRMLLEAEGVDINYLWS